MRAQSVWNPWAWALVTRVPGARREHGLKPLENRMSPCWQSQLGRWTLIHSGKKRPDRRHVEQVKMMAEESGLAMPEWATQPPGAIIGAVWYEESITVDQALDRPALEAWVDTDAEHCYLVRRAVAFDIADHIPILGKQSLFWAVPKDVETRARDLIDRVLQAGGEGQPRDDAELAAAALRAIEAVEGRVRWSDVARWMTEVLGPAIGMSPVERWHRMPRCERELLCTALEQRAGSKSHERRKPPHEPSPRRVGLFIIPPAGPRSVAPTLVRVGPPHSFEALRSRLSAEAAPTPRRIEHRCHAQGCNAPCPPRHLMCAPHWRMVPKPLQRWVWSVYRPGQETDKKPSAAYMRAADAAISAVAQAEVIRKSRFLR